MNTTGEGTRGYRLALVALLLFGVVGHALYLTVHCPIGLSGDEAHYWDWSRQLDWSYYSKGPAVAFIIRASCAVFGDTMFAVRFPALLLAALTSLATYWLTARVFASERLALGAVALTYCVPLFVAGSLLMTIDAPFYCCWAWATCLGYLAAVEGRRWAWPAAGVLVGLGFLAKYAALLWFVGLLIYLAVHRRRLLASPWPWLALAVALAFTTPVLYWNAHHDWVTFGHVARSTAEDQSHFKVGKVLGNFGALVGGQIGLLNPLVAGFMLLGVWTALRRERDERLAYLLAIGLPFFALVSLVTLRKNTEPNWPAPTYFTLVPLAAWQVARAWPKSKGWLVAAASIGVLAIVYLHEAQWFYRVVPVPPRKWDVGTRLTGYDDVGRAVSEKLRTLGPHPLVICDRYQLTALMAFYVDGHPKAFCIGPYVADPAERDRLSQYDLWPDRDLSRPALLGRDAVFVGHAPPDLDRAFASVERMPDLPVVRQGKPIRQQQWSVCRGFRGLVRPEDGRTKR